MLAPNPANNTSVEYLTQDNILEVTATILSWKSLILDFAGNKINVILLEKDCIF